MAVVQGVCHTCGYVTASGRVHSVLPGRLTTFAPETIGRTAPGVPYPDAWIVIAVAALPLMNHCEAVMVS